MLQFIAQSNDRYSVAEICQMAIEGGCRWIQLHLPELADDDIKAMASDIIALCSEAAAFLMLEDRPELAKDLGLHGVHLTALTDRSAAKVREELGPEAVIGVETGDAASILALRNADIDYVTLPSRMTLDEISALVKTVRDAGIETPLVASGDITSDRVSEYLSAGVSGIATGMPIIHSKNPVAAVAATLSALGVK